MVAVLFARSDAVRGSYSENPFNVTLYFKGGNLDIFFIVPSSRIEAAVHVSGRTEVPL